MRVILTDRKDYHLSPDIELCTTLEEVYLVVGVKPPTDEVLHIFVDLAFSSVSVLRQIEMFNTLVTDFKIIIDRNIEASVNSKKALNMSIYYVTETVKTATQIFINAQPLEDTNIEELKSEFSRLIDNPDLMQVMIEHDRINLQNLLKSILYTLDNMEESQDLISTELVRLIEENSLVKENLKIARERNKVIESNRKELLESNLSLKYNGYLDRISRVTTEITVPILYVKAPLMKEPGKVTNVLRVLKDLLINKYGKNVMYIVLEDPNALQIKKINEKFTYIDSNGRYNMDLGSQVITTPNYNTNLMKSYEEFTGVKDLFLILDLTPTPNVHTIGEGNLVYLTNESQAPNEDLNKLSGVVNIMEEDLLENYEGEDDFNLELNISRGDNFIKLEEIAASISI